MRHCILEFSMVQKAIANEMFKKYWIFSPKLFFFYYLFKGNTLLKTMNNRRTEDKGIALK